MAATNPFRVSDLIAKYGWKVMPFLSNLGVRSLAEAQILFVDSGSTNKLDADDTEHGHSLEKPLATIDYAVGLMTASEGGIILVAPGHAETHIAASSCVTADINGIKIIGLGEGLLRPTITLTTDTGAIAFTVSGANVTLANMRVLVSLNAVVSAISVTGTDCKLIDMEVQDNANNTEVAIAILTAATADRLHIERFKHNGFIDGDACTESISLIGVDRAVIKDSWFRGTFSTAAIQMVTTACSGVIIENCKFENKTTAMTTTIVDNAVSKWSAIKCWDVVGGYGFSGGSGSALASDDVSSVSSELAKVKDQAVGAGPTYFVDSINGDAGNDGLTWATAKKTIQQGVDLMIDHSTLYVGGVSYTEAVTLPVDIERGRIIGVCKANQIPYWQSGAVNASHLVINRGEWEIANFRFQSISATVANVTISFAGGSSIIRDCWFSGNDSESGIEAVGPDGAASDIKIVNNRFTGFAPTNTAAGAICGSNYDEMAAVCWEIIGNMF